MGEVYRARDTKLNRDVAIKVLPEQLAQRPGGARALRARGAGGRRAVAPEHPRDPRLRRRSGASPMRSPSCSRARRSRDARPERAARRARRSTYARPDRPRHRRRARTRHRPSRSEAGEHLHHERRRGEDPRLRPGEGGRARADSAPAPTQHRGGHVARHRAGHRRLHVARAGARASRSTTAPTSSRSARSSTRCSPAGGLPRRLARRDDERDPQGGPAGVRGRRARPCRRRSSASSGAASRSSRRSGSTRPTISAIALEALSGASSRQSAASIAAAPGAAGDARTGRRLAIARPRSSPSARAAFFAGRARRAPAPSTRPEYHRLTLPPRPHLLGPVAPDGKTIVYSARVGRHAAPVVLDAQESPESLPLPYPERGRRRRSRRTGELALVSNRRSSAGYAQPGTLARAPLSGGAVARRARRRAGRRLAARRLRPRRRRTSSTAGTASSSRSARSSTKPAARSATRASRRTAARRVPRPPDLGDDRGSLPSSMAPARGAQTSRRVRERAGTRVDAVGQRRSGSRGVRETAAARRCSPSRPTGAVRTVPRVPGNLILGDIGADGNVLARRTTTDGAASSAWRPARRKERDLSWLDWSQPPAFSDDGRTLVSRKQGDGGGTGYSVFLRKTDGSPAVRLGSGDALALSPDGKWVIAQQLGTHPAQLVLLPTGAGEARALTNDDITHLSAAFCRTASVSCSSASSRASRRAPGFRTSLAAPPKPVTPEGVAGLLLSPDGDEAPRRGTRTASRSFPGRRRRARAGPVRRGRPTASLRFTADGRAAVLVRRPRRRTAPCRFTRSICRRAPARPSASWPFRESVGMGGIGQLLMTPDASAYVYATA